MPFDFFALLSPSGQALPPAMVPIYLLLSAGRCARAFGTEELLFSSSFPTAAPWADLCRA
jgi:hypothetical protein